MRRVVAVAAAIGLAAFCACASQSSGPEAGVAVEVPALTLRQQIGQHFVFPFAGTSPPKALKRRIARGEAAGVILFARNIRSASQVRKTIAKLQAIKRPAGLGAPLLVMVDQEGGQVMRIPGAPMVAADQMGSSARSQGAATAKTLRGAGVNLDLAPVVDIARAGSAMAREHRAFGTDQDTVTRHAGAFSDAVRKGGVATALKHFPGFGAAQVNTDDAPARIDLPLSELRSIDLVPFKRIKAPAVLVSTAVYPQVDPRPAAFAARWLTDELRERIGFKGVVITDDLQTPAVSGYGTPVQLAYFAVAAGADIPLFAERYGTAARAADGLVAAVKTGKLDPALLDAGAKRVLSLRSTLGKASK